MRWAGVWHVWGRGEVRTEFWWLNLRERDHLEGLDVDDEGVDWINPAKNRNGWRAVVSTAMNLLFP
jgi:hypothetical protein